MGTRSIAAALAVAACISAPVAAAQPSIDVLTGSTSGVYYPLGVALAKIYSDIPDMKVRVRVTQGSVENLLLLQEGKGQIGFAAADALKAAWDGDAEAGFPAKLDRLRVIGATYPNYIQLVATKASGITTLSGLKGKSLAVGADRSGTALSARALLAAAGLVTGDLGTGDFARIEHLAFAESVTLMGKQQLDATLQSAGLGATSMNELSTTGGIVMIAIPEDVVGKLGPPFVPATIPANTYAGQDRDVPTAAVMNYLVTTSAVSDDLAYAMTQRMFDSLPKLAHAHGVGRGIRLETAADGGAAPLHPGALRFYREKGLAR